MKLISYVTAVIKNCNYIVHKIFLHINYEIFFNTDEFKSILLYKIVL